MPQRQTSSTTDSVVAWSLSWEGQGPRHSPIHKTLKMIEAKLILTESTNNEDFLIILAVVFNIITCIYLLFKKIISQTGYFHMFTEGMKKSSCSS